MTMKLIGGRGDESKIFAVAKMISELDPSAGTMKMQKLLYYVQGWALAWTGDPIFEDLPEAYRDGPVYPRVREDLQYCEGVRVDRSSSEDLSEEQVAIIRAVVKKYRPFSGREMANMTHREPPWNEARGDLPPDAPSSDQLSLRTMMRFFVTVPDEEAPIVEEAVGTNWSEPGDVFYARESARWGKLLDRLSA